MTKVLLAILTAAAFVYAVYLLARKRPLKIVSRRENESGFIARARYLFLLATAIIASGSFSRAQEEVERPSCYERVATLTPEKRIKLLASLRTAWLTLNTIQPNKIGLALRSGSGETARQGANAATSSFKQSLLKAVEIGLLSPPAAYELAIVHAALAEHYMQSVLSFPCYLPEMRPINPDITTSNLQQKLVFLRQAKEANTVSPEVVRKATEVIQTEMEVLKRLNDITVAAPTDSGKRQELEEQLAALIKGGKLKPSPETIEATALILELEDVTATAVPGGNAKTETPATPTVAPTGTPPAGKSSAAAPGAASAKGQ